MKNIFLKIAFISFTLLTFTNCSSDKDPENEVIVDPPVVETDPLTTSNVTTYMVDPNATKETIALFYNLKKLAKTKTAIGQQDAFSGIYNNGSSAESDMKKTTGYDPAEF
jgi:mannan endo-1,4-beta-mannosidase